MKIEFDDVMSEVSAIAKKWGCADSPACDIAAEVYHYLRAKGAGVTREQYAEIKNLYRLGSCSISISRHLGVPVRKVRKVIKPQL